jgi:hypothetical protein
MRDRNSRLLRSTPSTARALGNNGPLRSLVLQGEPARRMITLDSTSVVDGDVFADPN